MASFPGRTGRRRRVLNEELLSASSSQAALRAQTERSNTSEDAPRYCEAAGVEHHAQVTDFVPRRYATLLLLAVAGLISIAGLAALDHWADAISRVLGIRTASPLDFAAPGSLAAWMAAVLLLVTSLACLLVYSIRRHRVDDFRGRYRVWLAAATACLVLSVNSVAGLHGALADAASHHTGWWALRDGAVWWLALAGVPVAWVVFRVLLDVLECRLAATALVAALIAYSAALASYLGWNPIGLEPQTEPLVTVGLTLVGHWMTLLAVVAYARYVVLDAQGLIVHARRERRTMPDGRKASTAAREASEAGTMEKLQPVVRPRPIEWVDGRQPEPDPYDENEPDERGRKPSKSERKRLRKLKAQNRAA